MQEGWLSHMTYTDYIAHNANDSTIIIICARKASLLSLRTRFEINFTRTIRFLMR